MRPELVNDADLARARSDPAFRHRLLSDCLHLLLDELSKQRGMAANPQRAKQIREGVDLAMQLANLLQKPLDKATQPHAA